MWITGMSETITVMSEVIIADITNQHYGATIQHCVYTMEDSVVKIQSCDGIVQCYNGIMKYRMSPAALGCYGAALGWQNAAL